MTATLTFILPDEEDAFKTAASAAGWRCSLEQLDNWFRDKLKYGHEFKTAHEAIEEARVELLTLASDNGVRLFE